MAIAVDKESFKTFSYKFYALDFMDLLSCLGSLHKIFTSFSIQVSGLCMLCHNSYCIFSCYLPLTKPGLMCLCSCSSIYVNCPVTEVSSFYLPHLRTETGPISETLGSLFFFQHSGGRTDQEPSNSECYTSSGPFFIHL
jgi:hypothetical protein